MSGFCIVDRCYCGKQPEQGKAIPHKRGSSECQAHRRGQLSNHQWGLDVDLVGTAVTDRRALRAARLAGAPPMIGGQPLMPYRQRPLPCDVIPILEEE